MDPQKDLQPFGTAALGGEMLGAMVGGRAPAVEERLTPQPWSGSYGSVFVLVTGTWLSFLFGEH